jgi:hypothetical protein
MHAVSTKAIPLVPPVFIRKVQILYDTASYAKGKITRKQTEELQILLADHMLFTRREAWIYIVFFALHIRFVHSCTYYTGENTYWTYLSSSNTKSKETYV